MKVGQKSIVRWMANLGAKSIGQAARKNAVAAPRELDAELLRHVGGGMGSATQLPKVGGW
jgi:hypothetical protein